MSERSQARPVSAAEDVLDGILLAALDQVIVTLDLDGLITRVSVGAERLLGYPAGALLGRPVAQLLSPEPWPDQPMAFPQLIGADHGTPSRVSTLLRHDGTELKALVSVAPVRSDGVVTGAVLMAWEMQGERRAADAMRRAFEREHAAAERLRELARIKDDFVANVSHELRTPLTTVVGNTEMLLDGDAGELTAPQQRLLAAIERNARRLQTLVGDLLMLSRIQSGKIGMSVLPVVVQDVVDRALSVAAQQRASAAVHVSVDLADTPLVVEGDPDDLVRMLSNVLGNALKFTPAGGTVRVRLAGDGRYARIEVVDTGIGIPEDELGLVFDGFFRSSRSQRNESPGTGLGLTIARSIADRHAGTIDIRPAEPEGTAVTIRIPLTQL